MNISLKNIFIAAAILLGAWAIWYFSDIVVYVILAATISLVGQPLKKRFEKITVKNYRTSAGLAAFLTLISFVLIFLLVLSLFVPLVIKEARVISSINPQDVIDTFKEPLSKIESAFSAFILNNNSETTLAESLRSIIANFLSFANLSSFANSLVGATSNILVGFFSVLFIAFFFLKKENMLPNLILSITPDKHLDAIKNIMEHVRKMLRRYLLAVMLQSLIVSTLIFTGLSIIGVENALIIAFISGILNIIPYVGPLIAGCLGLIIGLTTNLQLDFYTAMIPFALQIITVYACAQFIDNFFLGPYIFSNTVNAHPLEIFIVILMAGTMAGIVGMIVAIPAYSILRIIAKEFFSNFKIIKKISEED